MIAVILAAGFGTRLRPLTLAIPKPLLAIGDRSLLEHHVIALCASGITEIIINLHYLGDKIKGHLGDGSRFGVKIIYSVEANILDTGGAIINILAYLQDRPFIIISADIYSDFDYTKLIMQQNIEYAHLFFVPNPEFKPAGDFAVVDGVVRDVAPRLTYSNIGVFHPRVFAGLEVCSIGLFKILLQFIAQGLVTGELFSGTWFNIGTFKELERCRQWVKKLQ